MNREFNPTSGRVRTALAAAALLATTLIAVSIEGLIDHYNDGSAGFASAAAVRIAQS